MLLQEYIYKTLSCDISYQCANDLMVLLVQIMIRCDIVVMSGLDLWVMNQSSFNTIAVLQKRLSAGRLHIFYSFSPISWL